MSTTPDPRRLARLGAIADQRQQKLALISSQAGRAVVIAEQRLQQILTLIASLPQRGDASALVASAGFRAALQPAADAAHRDLADQQQRAAQAQAQWLAARQRRQQIAERVVLARRAVAVAAEARTEHDRPPRPMTTAFAINTHSGGGGSAGGRNPQQREQS